MHLIFSRFLAYFYFGFQVVLHSFIDPCHLHPQPCHILAQIGHTVRLGALLPTRQPARVQAALNRALASLAQTGDNFLPYNLSLEMVPREPLNGDPESLFSIIEQGEPLKTQNRFHLQMVTRIPPSGLAELLLAVLQRSGWQEGMAVLCQGWEEAGVLELLELQSRTDWGEARWHLQAVLNLSMAEEEAEVADFLSEHFRQARPPPASVLLFGADPQCAATVLRSAHDLGLTLPTVHWIMGYPLSPDALHSIGLPLGLLAYGEVDRKPLDFYILDALQLVSRAVSSATVVRPDLALIQNMVNCYDKPNKHEVPSSGQYLARFLSNTSFTGLTGAVKVQRNVSRVLTSQRFHIWSLRRDAVGQPTWVTVGSWESGRLEVEEQGLWQGPSPRQRAEGQGGKEGRPLGLWAASGREPAAGGDVGGAPLRVHARGR
ncbi:hypothetical protein SKAU_G00053460 [Synaphobranchus kaupii]|uniref:Uncharacterized protein n=1 Tax=Synaphobranchus kaupii TaxID=118154 RepID=A0A9Q1G4C5_SYNKA|nr:hypothetical protein SKAU_G00053460 [Synaphobranchus kaupii]